MFYFIQYLPLEIVWIILSTNLVYILGSNVNKRLMIFSSGMRERKSALFMMYSKIEYTSMSSKK